MENQMFRDLFLMTLKAMKGLKFWKKHNCIDMYEYYLGRCQAFKSSLNDFYWIYYSIFPYYKRIQMNDWIERLENLYTNITKGEG